MAAKSQASFVDKVAPWFRAHTREAIGGGIVIVALVAIAIGLAMRGTPTSPVSPKTARVSARPASNARAISATSSRAPAQPQKVAMASVAATPNPADAAKAAS